MSIMFNEIRINEEKLQKKKYIYIYIYARACACVRMCVYACVCVILNELKLVWIRSFWTLTINCLTPLFMEGYSSSEEGIQSEYAYPCQHNG